ncbi:MAG: aminotransferase class I/II-fold pyridoxal phosphate-dependent enzyme [Alphaproteobacteria bacterium]|nr:aminotransferase class I/II-fold pyridoxal phosphate-dependent enzyme [Alphaproteobacteria bacterium]
MPIKKLHKELCLPDHGGDLIYAKNYFGEPNHPWVDLSTGINPRSYPFSFIKNEKYQKLPSQNDISKLLEIARNYYQTPDQVDIIAGPGSQFFLQTLPLFLQEYKNISILTPTYNEYAKCWGSKNSKITYVKKITELKRDQQILIICNPNNPNGAIIDHNVILDTAQFLKKNKGILIIDEAFVDPIPEYSIVPLLHHSNIIVLKSFGKFFGLAGLRLGFMISAHPVIQQINHFLGPWPISHPAIEIGIKAFNDKVWINKTKNWLQITSKKIHSVFQTYNFKQYKGTALFTFINDSRAFSLYQCLGKKGIYTRIYKENPSWIRIGMPLPQTFKRLTKALSLWNEY